MSEVRKCPIHGSVVELCSSTQSGLPLAAVAYVTLLIEGILAQATTLYPVTICHYVFMANHFHMIIVVQDPEKVQDFVGYVKQEIAHVLNRLCGTTGLKFWLDGFDSPIILDAEKLQERLLYLYGNPVAAGLVESIDEYPGVNSFKAVSSGEHEKDVFRIPRSAVTELPKRELSEAQIRELTHTLQSAKGVQKLKLHVQPWACFRVFHEERLFSDEKLRESLLRDIRLRELLHGRSRKTPVLGASKLRVQDPRVKYRSKRSGKRMIALSSDVDLRCSFIDWFKKQSKLAASAYQNWRSSKQPSYPPPGFFFPGGVLFSNLIFANLLL